LITYKDAKTDSFVAEAIKRSNLEDAKDETQMNHFEKLSKIILRYYLNFLMISATITGSCSSKMFRCASVLLAFEMKRSRFGRYYHALIN